MPDTTNPATSTRDVSTPYARLSAVEVAAKRGFGPLSEASAEVWHGHARPCVSCGELCRRGEHACPHCGQDLSPAMVQKMAAYAGPWFVHEHVRPFPGVTLERLVRQARRGVLTATTIVCGPSTHHQWRFAAETPGLAHHLGVCWNCQAPVTDQTYSCAACGAMQEAAPPAADGTLPASPTGSALDQIRQAVTATPAFTDVTRQRSGFRPPLPVVIFILIAVTIAGLMLVVQSRERARGASAERKATQAARTAPAQDVVPPTDAQLTAPGSDAKP